MLLGKTQTSAISGARRIRVLIASGDPERIMIVRESLHAWPEADVNLLIEPDYQDPISGFPGFKSLLCEVQKVEK